MSDVTKPVILDETGQGIRDAILQVASAINKGGIVYGFHINGSESDPDARVSYLKDAIGMTPAHMDYGSGKFDYGSWEGAFFMPRPCMLRKDGTVAYYLNPDDYSKKEDGTASDISDTTFAGNAMMEWGKDGKKIWVKVVPSADGKSGDIYIADHQADSQFHAWNFINSRGVMVDHFYTPIYNGANVSSVMRSMSGQQVAKTLNASTEITYCEANDPGTDKLWYTEVWADVLLINFLLILMGKSTNTQAVFGEGLHTGGTEAINDGFRTGVHNTKGLFYGTNSGSIALNSYGNAVKVFGMENWWGFQWRRIAGLMNVSGDVKYKLTYGTEDGSTAAAYNTTGSGYKSSGVTPSGTSGGYISEDKFLADGMYPSIASGTSSTYDCDGFWFNNGITAYAVRGGNSYTGVRVGALCANLDNAPSHAYWSFGCAPSCKPLV